MISEYFIKLRLKNAAGDVGQLEPRTRTLLGIPRLLSFAPFTAWAAYNGKHGCSWF